VSHITFSHTGVFRRDKPQCLKGRGITVNNIEVIYKLEQERLEKLRHEAHLYSLIKPQHISLRLRTARTLKHWAYRLSPELEPEFVLAHK
jgi:hypothetical protein